MSKENGVKPQSPNKAHDKEYGQDLFESLKRIAGLPANDSISPIAVGTHRGEELRKMKKFRFQLLHRWLVEHIEPARVADIGGGKGLLAYLLQQSGWAATVIDPVQQGLPDKYKDITTGRRVRIAPTERVRHINRAFATEMGAYFDLLIGMHAHGCNAQIIDSATVFGCGFVLFPCCVIDETVGAVAIFHNFPWLDAGIPVDPGTPASQTFRVEGGMNRYIHEVTACTTPGCGRGGPPGPPPPPPAAPAG
jgi:hypothetical protein